MKRLIVIFSALLFFVATEAQLPSVVMSEQTAVTLAATKESTGSATFTPSIQGEYDVSLQSIPASAADSGAYFTYMVYQSNSDVDAVWTEILTASEAVTSLTDADAITQITDFKGLRIKIIYTNTGTKAKTITPYMVCKKHANQ